MGGKFELFVTGLTMKKEREKICFLQVGTRIAAGEERRTDEVSWALDILVQDGTEAALSLVWGCLKVKGSVN